MIVYPAVDILGGRCVQLVQGKRETATRYGSPLECAHRWLAEGAEALHVINLDGAFGNARENVQEIRDLIRETGVAIQLGGGIRSVADACGWLDLGVERVILGTLAIEQPETVRTLAGLYGSERVMAGVDAKAGQVVVRGWEESAGDYLSWAARFEELGAGSLLFTNVDVEGLQQGIAVDPVSRLVAATRLPVVAAGGISSIEDVACLKEIRAAGIVLGSALYSGKIDLGKALEVSR